MADAASLGPIHFPRPRVVLGLAGAVATAFLLLPPHSVQGKLNLLGYGICHQDPNRSFSVGGRQLPICARDTGTYLGSVATLAVVLFRKERRAAGLPSPVVLTALAVGFAFFAVDGLNSYASALPWLPQLYTPDNRLRLLSGMGCGAGLAAVLMPLFNYTVWREPGRGRVLGDRSLAAVLAALLGVYAAVVWAPAWLYYPLALLSGFGIVLILSTVNGLLAVALANFQASHSR